MMVVVGGGRCCIRQTETDRIEKKVDFSLLPIFLRSVNGRSNCMLDGGLVWAVVNEV